MVSTFFIAFFSDFSRKGFVEKYICNRMVPLFFSNFNFQRCRYQVKLSVVDDIMRDLYSEKSKMNVRSILISRKRTVSLI